MASARRSLLPAVALRSLVLPLRRVCPFPPSPGEPQFSVVPSRGRSLRQSKEEVYFQALRAGGLGRGADDGAQSEATRTQTTFFMISFNHKCHLRALSAYFGLILLYVQNWGTKRRDATEAHSR